MAEPDLPVPPVLPPLKRAAVNIEWQDLDKQKLLLFNPVVFFFIRALQHPLTVVKTKFQVQKRHSLYASPWKTLMQTYTREGVPGLYRGFGTSSLMLVVQQVYMFMYEFLRAEERFPDHARLSEPTRNALAAATSVLAVQVIGNPIDVVSQRLFVQGQHVSNAPMGPPQPPSRTMTVGGVASGTSATAPGVAAASALSATPPLPPRHPPHPPAPPAGGGGGAAAASGLAGSSGTASASAAGTAVSCSSASAAATGAGAAGGQGAAAPATAAARSGASSAGVGVSNANAARLALQQAPATLASSSGASSSLSSSLPSAALRSVRAALSGVASSASASAGALASGTGTAAAGAVAAAASAFPPSFSHSPSSSSSFWSRAARMLQQPLRLRHHQWQQQQWRPLGVAGLRTTANSDADYKPPGVATASAAPLGGSGASAGASASAASAAARTAAARVVAGGAAAAAGAAASAAAAAASSSSLPLQEVMIPRPLTARELASQVYRTHGLLVGFYAGFWISCAQFIPSTSLWWWSYPLFRDRILVAMHSLAEGRLHRLHASHVAAGGAGPGVAPEDALPVSPATAARIAEALAGSLASATVAIGMNPMDILRTRVQVEGKGAIPILRELVATEGVRGLWKGTTARIAMLTPQGALTVGAYELVKRLSAVDPTVFEGGAGGGGTRVAGQLR